MADVFTQAAAAQKVVQSANVEWVFVDVTATPTKIIDLIIAAGLHTRLDVNEEDLKANIVAISILPRTGDVRLRTESADASNFRTVAAADTGYFPTVMVWAKHIDIDTPETIQLEVFHEKAVVED